MRLSEPAESLGEIMTGRCLSCLCGTDPVAEINQNWQAQDPKMLILPAWGGLTSDSQALQKKALELSAVKSLPGEACPSFGAPPNAAELQPYGGKYYANETARCWIDRIFNQTQARGCIC